MNKQTLIEKIKSMIASPSCHPDLKKVANAYLNALVLEQTAAKNFLAELEESIVDVDGLVEFAHSPKCVEYFKGNESAAKKFAENADALKAHGEKYCNCFACTVGLEILEHKDILLN